MTNLLTSRLGTITKVSRDALRQLVSWYSGRGIVAHAHARAWLKAAGLSAEQFIEAVKSTITDGEVCDWVMKNVRKTDAEKNAHRDAILNYGKDGDEALMARMKLRKEQAGLAHRDDIQTFVDFIDADEKRI